MRMDCADIEEALLAGEDVKLEQGAAATHLAGCETCRYLVSGDGVAVARALGGGRRGAGEARVVVEGLEAAVLAQVRDERGWRARLRESSRGARTAVVAAVVALEALVLFAVARRVDWAVYPGGRMLFAAGGLAVVSLGVAWMALRPMWMRPLRWGMEVACAAVAVGFPLLLAALPEVPTVPRYDGAGAWFAARCFAIGCALGGVVFAVARWMDRGTGARWPLIAAAMAGGVSAALALQLECPVNHPWHLVTGHALPVVALAVAALVMWRRG